MSEAGVRAGDGGRGYDIPVAVPGKIRMLSGCTTILALVMD
jgi:hypothetical protein